MSSEGLTLATDVWPPRLADSWALGELLAERAGLPVPLPALKGPLPTGTARKGARRIKKPLSSRLGRNLTDIDALRRSVAGDMTADTCEVMWNVNDRPVVQSLRHIAVPEDPRLRPMRRVGSFKKSRARPTTLQISSGGMVVAQTFESRLEASWVLQALRDPGTESVLAQPCAFIWRFPEGNFVRILDIAVVNNGVLHLYEVKPLRYAQEFKAALGLEILSSCTTEAGVSFEHLTEMSPQHRRNLELLHAHRDAAPQIAEITAYVVRRQPRTLGGVNLIVEEWLRETFGARLQGVSIWDTTRLGLHVARHLCSSERFCRIDLAEPLSLSTELTWRDAALEGWCRS